MLWLIVLHVMLHEMAGYAAFRGSSLAKKCGEILVDSYKSCLNGGLKLYYGE